MSGESIAVAEEIISNIPVVDNIHRVQVILWGTILDESAQILAKEAANVERRGASLQSLNNIWVGRRFGDHRIEPEAETSTWIRAYGPGFFPLNERVL